MLGASLRATRLPSDPHHYFPDYQKRIRTNRFLNLRALSLNVRYRERWEHPINPILPEQFSNHVAPKEYHSFARCGWPSIKHTRCGGVGNQFYGVCEWWREEWAVVNPRPFLHAAMANNSGATPRRCLSTQLTGWCGVQMDG